MELVLKIGRKEVKKMSKEYILIEINENDYRVEQATTKEKAIKALSKVLDTLINTKIIKLKKKI